MADVIEIPGVTNTIEVVGGDGTVQVIEIPTSAIQIVEVNAQGPAGRDGTSGGTVYAFTQALAASTWTVNHNLGVYPVVEIFTTGGATVDADIIHTSANQFIVYFSIPTAGTARCI